MYRFHPAKGWQLPTVEPAGWIKPDSFPRCRLPREFAVFTGDLPPVQIRDAQQAPSTLVQVLAAEGALLLTGPYPYIDGVHRFCQRQKGALVGAGEIAHFTDPVERRAVLKSQRRQRLHRLLVAMQGERLLQVDQAPPLSRVPDWLQEPPGPDPFLIPVRRLQRILTDIERARQGLPVQALGQRLAILPHVYVPSDQSVPSMLLEYGACMEGRRVLDVGTGTGILALLAARLGAAQVVAVDFNDNAVRNARLNVGSLGFGDRIEVPPPGDLFQPVRGRRFDTILFNAPWIQGSPQSLYDTALYDPDFQVLDAFLDAAPRYLAPGGSILLQYAHIALRSGQDGRGHLHQVLAANGLEIIGAHVKEHQSRLAGGRAQLYLYEICRKGSRSQ
ncbi:MAG: methyltransferase domain-containing protein [Candidatus Latescibacteria bacterium]|nr:methyltransferase domain-containing protein [Candidatus Latescibacterota bacterium]